jgi:hypothetical protein
MNDSAIPSEAPYVPIELYCPMTLHIFKEPVILGDNFTYEKDWAIQWLAKSDKSPLTNKKLPHKRWQINQTFKNQITTYLDRGWITKEEQYQGVKPKTKNKDVIHFSLLKAAVKNNFWEHSGKNISDDLLQWLYQSHPNVFRYLNDRKKSKVLAIFHQATEDDIRIFFNTHDISIMNDSSKILDDIAYGLSRMKDDIRNYDLFIARFGSISEFLQLPCTLMGKLLAGAYLIEGSHDQTIKEEKTAHKLILRIEETLTKLGIDSLHDFKSKILPQKENHVLCRNICEIIEGWHGYPTKIMGQKISKDSNETMDLFELAKLPITTFDTIVAHPVALETLLLNENISWQDLSTTPSNKLAIIFDPVLANDFSESVISLLNSKKLNFQELTTITDAKLKLILQEAISTNILFETNKAAWNDLIKLSNIKLKIIFKHISYVTTFLKNGIHFSIFYKFKANTLKLFLINDKRTPYIPVTSFLREIEIPITALNEVNPNHPALNWFLKNIHSLELTYKHENHNEFKEIIDHAVKRNDSINELITLISQYDNWPQEYNIEPFIQQEEKDWSSAIPNYTNTTAYPNEHDVKDDPNEHTDVHPCIITPKQEQTSFITTHHDWANLRERTYENDLPPIFNKPDSQATSSNKTYALMLIIYGLGGLCGLVGETYHILSQHQMFHSNKPLVIGLLAAASFLLLIGFIIQLAKRKPSKQHHFCSLNTLAHIIFFGGVLSVAGSATSLYFDCNKLNITLFIASASLIIIGAVSILLIDHFSLKSNDCSGDIYDDIPFKLK